MAETKAKSFYEPILSAWDKHLFLISVVLYIQMQVL